MKEKAWFPDERVFASMPDRLIVSVPWTKSPIVSPLASDAVSNRKVSAPDPPQRASRPPLPLMVSLPAVPYSVSFELLPTMDCPAGVVGVVVPTSFGSARSAAFGVPKFCVTNTTL